MINVVDNLISNINITSLFNSILPIIPLIIIFFSIAFGLNILRQNLSMRYWLEENEKNNYYENLDDEDFERSFRNHHN